ncbi:MAG: hypothetical protein JWM27_108 [Gemmatimonadetes bacterium]|nr:hypothetical protein [Gemmatimonadota bacterium]
MTTDVFARVLPTIFRELVDGAPDPATRTYMLNRGDPGLLAALDRLSAAAASESSGGGPSIAAHVDHLRYGFSLLNRWAAGTPVPWKETDWSASWARNVVSEEDWRALRDELARETAGWAQVLASGREVSEMEAGWITGSVAHVAYHLGAIRQIDRAARGPTAEDEHRAEVALRQR